MQEQKENGMYAGLSPSQVLDQLAAHLALFFPSIRETPQDGRKNVNAAQYEVIKAAAEKWHAETGAPVSKNGGRGEGGIAKELDSLRRFHGCPGIPYRRIEGKQGGVTGTLPGLAEEAAGGERDAVALELRALREELGARLWRLEGLLGEGVAVFRRLLGCWEGGGGDGGQEKGQDAEAAQDAAGEPEEA